MLMYSSLFRMKNTPPFLMHAPIYENRKVDCSLLKKRKKKEKKSLKIVIDSRHKIIYSYLVSLKITITVHECSHNCFSLLA